MISAAVITAALAFWAPYNGGQAPCSGQLAVHDADPAVMTAHGWDADAYAPVLVGGCDVFINWRSFNLETPDQQCATIAHEVGHAFFALSHSSDRTNIMWPDTATRPIPPICAALDPRRRRAAVRRPRCPKRAERRHGFFEDNGGGCVRHRASRANAAVPKRRGLR